MVCWWTFTLVRSFRGFTGTGDGADGVSEDMLVSPEDGPFDPF